MNSEVQCYSVFLANSDLLCVNVWILRNENNPNILHYYRNNPNIVECTASDVLCYLEPKSQVMNLESVRKQLSSHSLL
jgi:hypothetical protein